MRNTEIIYTASGKPRIETIKVAGRCKICGAEITEGVRERDAISGNFSNFGECKARDSVYVCGACVFCIKDEKLRWNNFVSDAKHLYLLKKNDLEEYLFNLVKYVEGEFVIGITTSFKKHNSFRCKVNSEPNQFWIRQEDAEYIFDTVRLKSIYALLNEAYLQFSKDEMLKGQYKMISIEQYGLDKFRQLEDILKPHRGTAQFGLLVYMLNSEKRQEYMQSKIAAQKFEKEAQKQCRKQEKTQELQQSPL